MPIQEVPKELDIFLRTLTDNLGTLIDRNAIPKEWLSSNIGNRERWLHARVEAILAKTGFALDYEVEVESGFSPQGGRQFRPDLQLWRSDHHSFLIEYESTNSSDSRVLSKDLRHYEESQNNETFPDFWLIIYTLPDKPVKEWTSWDYGSRYDPGFIEMKSNPHIYYKQVFENPSRYFDSPHLDIGKFTELNGDWHSRKIILINLSEDGLEIDYPTSLSKTYPFS